MKVFQRLDLMDEVVNPNTGHKINMKKLLEDQSIAIASFTAKYPFFQNLAYKLIPVYTFQVSTQATDGVHIFINPEFTDKLNLRQKAFVLAHEVMHCVMNHMERGRYHDHQRSNIAADYEVNWLLVNDGFVKKNDITSMGALYDDKYANMPYEEIYAKNPPGPKAPPIQRGGGQGQGQQGQSQQGQGSGQGQSQQGQGQQGNQPSQGGDGQGQQGNQPSQGGDGQGQGQDGDQQQGQGGGGGNQPSGEASEQARKEAAQAGVSCGGFISPDAGNEIARSEGHDTSGEKKSESKIASDWKETAMAEAQKAKNSGGQGRGSGSCKSIIKAVEGLYLTAHNWKNELKRIMGRALAKYDNEKRMGKKKYLNQGVVRKYFVPGRGDGLQSVIFNVDVSGSVSADLLHRILSECYTICYRKEIEEVTYLYYDTEVLQIETNTSLKEARAGVTVHKLAKNKMARGNVEGGGTNCKCAMDWIENVAKKDKRNFEDIELVMFFTDGQDEPVARPKFVKHMIWVVYDNPGFRAVDDSKVIYLNSKDIGV